MLYHCFADVFEVWHFITDVCAPMCVYSLYIYISLYWKI